MAEEWEPASGINQDRFHVFFFFQQLIFQQLIFKLRYCISFGYTECSNYNIYIPYEVIDFDKSGDLSDGTNQMVPI